MKTNFNGLGRFMRVSAILIPAVGLLACGPKAPGGANAPASTPASASGKLSTAQGGTAPQALAQQFSSAAKASATGLPQKLRVLNAASYTTALAPNTISAAFGTELTDLTLAAPQPLPQMLNNIRVVVGPQYAKIIFVSPTQVNFITPNLAPGTYDVILSQNFATIGTAKITLAAAAPGLFTVKDSGIGTPKAQAWNGGTYDSIFNSDLTPRAVRATQGSSANILILYGTGFRGAPKNAQVDDLNVFADYAGAHSVFEGLDQMNLKIPAGLVQAKARLINVRIGGTPAGGGYSNWVRVCLAGTTGDSVCPAPTSAQIVNVKGSGQAGPNFFAFGDELTARVLDSRGVPIEGATVTSATDGDPNRAPVNTRYPSAVTDINGIASFITFPSGGDSSGNGFGTIRLSVNGATGPLSTEYLLNAILADSRTGIWTPGYSVSTNTGDYLIQATANTTLTGAITGVFGYGVGPNTGRAFPNLGMYVTVVNNPESDANVTAICDHGIDEVGTQLTNATGNAQCDLKVGPGKGLVEIQVHLFGAGIKTYQLNVQ